MNEATLNELCIEKGVYGVPYAAVEFDENKYRYLRISDISDDGVLLHDDKKSVEGENLENYLLTENDIVFARTGNSTGRAFFYEKKYGVLVYAGFLIRFKLDEKKINPKYVRYYTISKIYRDWIKNTQDGSTRGNMNAQTFATLPIFYPDRPQQDKIVSILDLLMNKIEKNNKFRIYLEKFLVDIFIFWFLQYEFPDKNGHPYKSSGGAMVWDDVLNREIPKDWKVEELGEHLTSSRGISYNSGNLEGDGIPMINLASFGTNGTYKDEGIKNYSGEYPQEKTLKPYDLVMCNTQQTAIDFEKDIIGKAFLVPDIFEGDIVHSHHVTKITVKNEDYKYYLCRLFDTRFFHKYIAGFTNGTNILGLDFSGVETYKTEIPDDDLLKKFAELSLDIEKKKSEIIKENKELASLRDFLLPLLMNGQVTFKD